MFFFNDTATTEIYTLSLHDALPISRGSSPGREPDVYVQELWRYPVKSLQGERVDAADVGPEGLTGDRQWALDRKSTRLNSSHANISYAVFCLKNKHYSPTSGHKPSI